jgi:hypothetical protein
MRATPERTMAELSSHPVLPSSASTSARAADTAPDPVALARQQARRGSWLKTLHRWHWISSAIALFGMLMFAITGITLNHAGAIESSPQITTRTAAMPAELATLLQQQAEEAEAAEEVEQPLPLVARRWLADALDLHLGSAAAEWSADEIYLALPRPGGDAWLRLDLGSQEAEYELTSRGWVAWLNDLHKGRNTGAAWSAFIDIFAIACVVFSITGLLILQVHAANRALVWPMVGLGVVIPAVLILLFIH